MMCFERGDSKYSEDLFGKPELVLFHLSPIYCKESEERIGSGPDESMTIIYSNIVALCVNLLNWKGRVQGQELII